MFDAHRAIDSVVSQRTKFEQEEWQKYQEEEKEKLRSLDLNAFYGFNTINLALRELEKGESDFEYTRLAEGYALIGDFQKAYETTRDPLKKAEYKQVLDAFNQPDCPCPTVERFGKQSVPVRFVKLQFGDKQLVECSRCSNRRVC